MALAPSSSPRGLGPPEEAVRDAVRDFQSILTKDQHAELQRIKSVPDANAVLIFTAKLDESNRSRRGRSIASRMHGVLESVREFSAVVDTFVSARPEIAALVWGSVKLTMLVANGKGEIAVNATSYFEPLSNLFTSLRDHYPRFAAYHALYPNSPRLQKALCDFHAAIVRCCKHAVEVIHRPWQRQIVNSLWQSFEMEFQSDADAIQGCGKEVKAEVALAKAQADRQDQELQKKEREAASKSRLTLNGFMSKANDGIDNIRQEQLQRDQRRARKQRLLLLEKLSSHDHLSPFREARKKRLCNTGEWILLTPQFNRWISASSSSLLWCSGKKVGSGKTILAASAIENVFAKRCLDDDETVAFFFIRYDDPESLKAETVFRSVIRQSLDPVTISEKMEAGLRKLDSMLYPSLKDLADLLRQRIALSQTFYLFIDALDECEPLERHHLLDALSSISNTTSKLKIFLAGRESLSVELRQKFPVTEQISTESVEARPDMSVYVEAALLERRQTQELCIESSLFEELKHTLAHHADGMILWVSYLIDDLCSYNCEDDIRKALGDLPKDLEETFKRVLSRIVSRRNDKIARRILPWVAVAKRNMTLEELRQAISTEIEQPYSRPETMVQGIENIVTWCENLLHVDEENKTVHFAHRTIYDFLCNEEPMSDLADFGINIEDADHRAGEICVTYLHFNDFKTTLAQSQTQQQSVNFPAPQAIARIALKRRGKMAASGRFLMALSSKRNSNSEIFQTTDTFATFKRADTVETMTQLQMGHPFLNYAATYWIDHTAGFQTVRSATWKLWKHMVVNGHALARLSWPGFDFHSNQSQIFRWACHTRHYALADFIQSCGNVPENENSSALIKGDARLMSIFLQGKVSDNRLEELLFEGWAQGDAWLITMLLRRKISTQFLNRSLQRASRYGDLEIAELLLAAGANINALPARMDGRTALQAASEGGHLGIVEWLLANGANVRDEPADDEGRTALQAASEGGHLAIIERLLAEGAKVNDEPAFDEGRTALQAASEGGHLAIIERLLAEGAKVNAEASRRGGRTALQAACWGGHLEVVERLLADGADVNTKPTPSSGLTALQAACWGGHLEVVERLLAKGADVNAEPAKHGGSSALQAARDGGHFKIVELLERAGATEVWNT
ncbi:hypothetical protein CP533_2254 [Ophiocordyceps camponoti-saundersi (nom. inval.)]|nr:hypothetical protein CP533_2254 [Ophiocordyceps camponoti-saundersi (nom. inval.)]